MKFYQKKWNVAPLTVPSYRILEKHRPVWLIKMKNSNQPQPDCVSKSNQLEIGWNSLMWCFLLHNLMLSITSFLVLLLEPSAACFSFTVLYEYLKKALRLPSRQPQCQKTSSSGIGRLGSDEIGTEYNVKWYWFKCFRLPTLLFHHHSFHVVRWNILIKLLFRALCRYQASERIEMLLFLSRDTYYRRKLFSIKVIAHEALTTKWADEFSWSNGILSAPKMMRDREKNAETPQEPSIEKLLPDC